MTKNHLQGSAKIYQFPARERVAAGGYRGETKPVPEMVSSRVAKVACGSAWYHEEAIEDAIEDAEWSRQH